MIKSAGQDPESLIEGRKPNYHLSLSVAQDTSQEIAYSAKRGLLKHTLSQILLDALETHKGLARNQIDELLKPALPSVLNEQQMKNKVMNLLSDLRRRKKIVNTGTNYEPMWKLHS